MRRLDSTAHAIKSSLSFGVLQQVKLSPNCGVKDITEKHSYIEITGLLFRDDVEKVVGIRGSHNPSALVNTRGKSAGWKSLNFSRKCFPEPLDRFLYLIVAKNIISDAKNSAVTWNRTRISSALLLIE